MSGMDSLAENERGLAGWRAGGKLIDRLHHLPIQTAKHPATQPGACCLDLGGSGVALALCLRPNQ